MRSIESRACGPSVLLRESPSHGRLWPTAALFAAAVLSGVTCRPAEAAVVKTRSSPEAANGSKTGMAHRSAVTVEVPLPTTKLSSPAIVEVPARARGTLANRSSVDGVILLAREVVEQRQLPGKFDGFNGTGFGVVLSALELNDQRRLHRRARRGGSSASTNASFAEAYPTPDGVETVSHLKKKHGGYMHGSPLFVTEKEMQAREAEAMEKARREAEFWLATELLLLLLICLCCCSCGALGWWSHHRQKEKGAEAKKEAMGPGHMRPLPFQQGAPPASHVSDIVTVDYQQMPRSAGDPVGGPPCVPTSMCSVGPPYAPPGGGNFASLPPSSVSPMRRSVGHPQQRPSGGHPMDMTFGPDRPLDGPTAPRQRVDSYDMAPREYPFSVVDSSFYGGGGPAPSPYGGPGCGPCTPAVAYREGGDAWAMPAVGERGPPPPPAACYRDVGMERGLGGGSAMTTTQEIRAGSASLPPLDRMPPQYHAAGGMGSSASLPPRGSYSRPYQEEMAMLDQEPEEYSSGKIGGGDAASGPQTLNTGGCSGGDGRGPPPRMSSRSPPRAQSFSPGPASMPRSPPRSQSSSFSPGGSMQLGLGSSSNLPPTAGSATPPRAPVR